MNNKPLILTASVPEILFRMLKMLLMTLLCLGVLLGLKLASESGVLPTVLCCVLYVPFAVLTPCFFCGIVDAVICLCDKKAVILTDTDITVYNLPPVPLCEIRDMTLLPEKKAVKSKLVLTLTDDRKVTVFRRTVNLPLPLLQESINLRKNK